MKGKDSPRKRNKLSFVVDRDEIDINSDWVSAVLRSPAEEDNIAHRSENSPPPGRADISYGEKHATVASLSPVENNTTKAVKDNATDKQHATVAGFASVVLSTTGAKNLSVVKTATVVKNVKDATVELAATVGKTAIPEPRRHPKPRPIRSILDGLTPGQFTVYSLMWRKGGPCGEGKRLYGGGYRALCDLTGMSKRGIQNVVAELQDKGPLSIHQAPGYHRTQFSVYEVLGEEQVLQLWRQRGYQYAFGKAKTLSAFTVAV